MNSTAGHLLQEFEALPETEKHVFARLILRRLPPLDSGDISDDELCRAGDELAAMMLKEEANDSAAR